MNPSAKGWLNKLLNTVDTDFSDGYKELEIEVNYVKNYRNRFRNN